MPVPTDPTVARQGPVGRVRRPVAAGGPGAAAACIALGPVLPAAALIAVLAAVLAVLLVAEARTRGGAVAS